MSPTTPTQGLALLRKLQPPEGDYIAPKCCGLWFSLTAVCMSAVSAAAFLPRVCVCVLPDPELQLWLKLSFIVFSYLELWPVALQWNFRL